MEGGWHSYRIKNITITSRKRFLAFDSSEDETQPLAFTFKANENFPKVLVITNKEEKQKKKKKKKKKKRERERSRECHNHKPQPFPDTKRKKKPTNPNKRKSNKRTKTTKISSLFPKRGNHNAKRTEKHKNKMTQGKT